jgi:hypothetical protein
METKKTQKIAKKFCCCICDYNTCNKYDYTKHLSTDKHIFNEMETNGNTKSQKIAKKTANTKTSCDKCDKCDKMFKTRAGLWKHSKKCNNNQFNSNTTHIELSNDFVCDKELVMKLINQNNELQCQVLELLKSGTHNTNSHNKTFNLNFFLNETCKNAMNIMDFVSNLQLQLNDLEKMGEIGYVNGMSEIIIKNLKDMDVTERPIHCTDKKRETLYIKDEDKWDKEPSDHPKVRHVIKHIAHKNSKLLNEFKEKYPDYNNSSSKVSDTYNKILIETMGGKGDNDLEKENKIIRNVTKEIVVDK